MTDTQARTFGLQLDQLAEVLEFLTAQASKARRSGELVLRPRYELEVRPRYAVALFEQFTPTPAQTYGWTSRYREALSQPELTDEEKKAFLASLSLAVILWLHMAGIQNPAVANWVQNLDATIGLGLFVYAALYAIFLKK